MFRRNRPPLFSHTRIATVDSPACMAPSRQPRMARNAAAMAGMMHDSAPEEPSATECVEKWLAIKSTRPAEADPIGGARPRKSALLMAACKPAAYLALFWRPRALPCAPVAPDNAAEKTPSSNMFKFLWAWRAPRRGTPAPVGLCASTSYWVGGRMINLRATFRRAPGGHKHAMLRSACAHANGRRGGHCGRPVRVVSRRRP